MARAPVASNLAMHARCALVVGLALLAWGCATGSAVPPAATVPPAAAGPAALPATPLTETQQALHLLNRLGYGPRPGDLEAVRSVGAAAWVEAQLHPERMDDGPAGRRWPRSRSPR
jgi:hypothetical protein